MRHGRGVNKALGGVKTTRKSKCNWYFISIHAYTLQNQVTYNKSATVSLCKYSAITVTHLNVRSAINMQTLKVIFFFKIKRITAIFLHKVYTGQQPNDILIRCNTLSLTSLTLTFCPWSTICYTFFMKEINPILLWSSLNFTMDWGTYIIVNVWIL